MEIGLNIKYNRDKNIYQRSSSITVSDTEDTVFFTGLVTHYLLLGPEFSLHSSAGFFYTDTRLDFGVFFLQYSIL